VLVSAIVVAFNNNETTLQQNYAILFPLRLLLPLGPPLLATMASRHPAICREFSYRMAVLQAGKITTAKGR